MKIAIKEAEKARAQGEVPVGAVITNLQGEVISLSGNRNIELKDPTAHAEILALRQACQILGTQRLVECFIYVTLEPCLMCKAAISLARIKRLYFGAYDLESDILAEKSKIYFDQKVTFIPEIYGGIEEETCRILLKDFFLQLRAKN